MLSEDLKRLHTRGVPTGGSGDAVDAAGDPERDAYLAELRKRPAALTNCVRTQ